MKSNKAARRIVSVTFDDGTRASVTDEELRNYLAHRELQAEALRRGRNVATVAMHRAIRKMMRDAGRIDTLRKVRKTHDADARRTESSLREAIRNLRRLRTPAHRIRSLAAAQVGITRARADQILGPVKKSKRRRKTQAPS